MTLLTLSQYVAREDSPIGDADQLRKMIAGARRQYKRALQVAKAEGYTSFDRVPVPPILDAVSQPSKRWLVDPDALTAALTRSAAEALREGLT